MRTARFDIVLEQPVIVSQQSASAGAHQCLDYIPGSVLLGLVAGRLYAELGADRAWTLFHSGKVRFGDALPLDQAGFTAYPVPLCWHVYKGEAARDARGRLRADALFDPSRFECDRSRQPVQLRGGYTTVSGQFIEPGREATLKTAIDPDTGMAAESQLFGYQALAAGQRYRATIHADADLAAADWQHLLDHLPGQARLGRSRSAQFGRVCIHAAPEATQGIAPNETGSTELSLWLLSDLALERRGQPWLQPDPEMMGLPAGTTWRVDRSFLRTRRYSPYNAYRRHYDSERQVIARGTVLCYALPRPLTGDEVHALQSGLGRHIESGLGHVWVNPALIAGEKPQFEAEPAARQPTVGRVTIPSRPDSVLLDVLERRRARRIGVSNAEREADTLYAALCDRIREARRFAALADGVPLATAPGRSQWGRLKELASELRRPDRQEHLWVALTDVNDGVMRARSGWDTRYGPEPDQQLHRWMHDRLKPLAGHHSVDLAAVIGHLAVRGLQLHWETCVAGTEPNASQEDAA